MSSQEEQVLRANDAFYEAFSDRDPEAMAAIWAQGAPVSCAHPGWNLLVGRQAVLESWTSILGSGAAPRVVSSREVIHVLGDSALVLCVETLPQGELLATNVFVRESAHWKIVHHQAGMIASATSFDDTPPSGLLN